MSVERDFAFAPRPPVMRRRRRKQIAREDFPLHGCVDDHSIPIPCDFRLESGGSLPDGTIELRQFGRSDGPVVAVAGGISATRHLCGDLGWWNDVVGPGRGVDPEHYCVLGYEFAPLGDHHIAISPRDQARLLEIALDALGIKRLHAYVGASYGGMVGLSFAALAPERLKRLCVISAAHKPAPMALAWRGVQRRTVEFAIEQGAPERGLALARQLAMTTYRSAGEFEQRFLCLVGPDGRSDIDRYLIARGEAYARTVKAKRWLSLSGAIDLTSVTPETVRTATTLVASSSDQLVPFAAMQDLARRLPRLKALHAIHSVYGHDAFLKEGEQIAAIVRSCLKDNLDV